MADEIGALAVSAAGASMVQGQPSLDLVGADLATRIRNWWLEANAHKLWVDYRRNKKEDEGFYIGGDGQWSVDGSTEDLERLKAGQRVHVSINHIQAIVDVLTGFERQNRFDLKAAPQGEEDVDDARILTWLLKWAQEQTGAHEVSSEVFEDGVIKGMKALEVGIDWVDDPVNGSIRLEELEPGEDVIWDPFWTKWDLSDARYVLKYKHPFVQDVIAEYPDKAEEILAATSDVDQFRDPTMLTEGDPRDGYGGVRSPSREYATNRMFYDPAEQKVMIIEAYYLDYEDVWLVSDKLAGKVYEAETATAARETAAADPENMSAVRRRKRVIRMAVVLPATYQVLEEGNPYENDRQAYPIVPYIAKRKGDTIYGIVANLKDPQRIENKRESQILDILATYANIRPMGEQTALENPQTLKDPWSREPIWLKSGHQGPGWYVPPLAELFGVLTRAGDRNKLAIRESSGINTDLLGIKSDDASGIAIARRQAQGQVISTVFFDNYRRFRRLVGQRLARRIQQVFSTERTMRLTNEVGGEVFVTVNPVGMANLSPAEAKTAAAEKKQTILRRIDQLKYDVVISEAPSTPTMRATSLLALLEIIRVVPAMAAAVMDIIVELAEIPDRARVLERVRQIMGIGGGPPNVAMGGGGPEPNVPPPAGAPGRPPLATTQGGPAAAQALAPGP